MASKFVAAVALLALCHANPVLINDILYRDGRSYSVGQASSYGGGESTAQATAQGDAAQAFGSAIGSAQQAGGYYYPRGQAIAQAQTDDAPLYPESAYGAAKAHNGPYYPIPAPATVITYEQNFVPAASAESHADSQGGGIAQSSAKTQGGYGSTSTNANSQGLGSAHSNANSRYASTSSSAKSHGKGSAVSSAQNNGVVYPAAPAALADQPAPTVVDLRTPIYYTPYAQAVPAGAASSNAIVAGEGYAASSAKVGHGQGRTISWRFGTFYDAPASTHAQANTYAGHGAAKSTAQANSHGSANANTAVNGYGSAKSVADTHHGHGIAQSYANSHRGGYANANANVNSAGFGGARSTADVHSPHYGGSSSANAHTDGSGSAASSARTQGVLNTVIRVANSQANSSGHGSADAKAQSF